MCHLVFINHLTFLHLFNRNNFSSLFVSAYSHFTKGSSSNNLKRIEVFNRNFCTTSQKHVKFNKTYLMRINSASLCCNSVLICSFSLGVNYILSIWLISWSQASFFSRSSFFYFAYLLSIYALTPSARSRVELVGWYGGCFCC